MQDAVGALIVSFFYFLYFLIFAVPIIAYSWAPLWENSFLTVMSIFSVFIMPTIIGLFAWSESRRQGKNTGVGMIYTVTFRKYYLRGFIWGLCIIIFFIIIVSPIILFGASNISYQPVPTRYPYGLSFNFIMFLTGLPILIFFPLLMSFGSLSGWAIAKGETLGSSFKWVLARIRKRFFRWWAYGFANMLIVVLGTIFCYIRIFILLPWIAIQWAELAGAFPEDYSDDES
ncbi:MAG TPA: hypothetical protein ENN67_06840 [Firmicutes bacterium]|nr:hypothetical protein [Bacillota bacterium]